MLATNKRNFSGFTIVELLVVIVVIGILAAITIVSYTGISQKAVASSLQADLSNNSKKLKMYQADYGSFPTSLDANNCPLLPIADTTKYCIKFSAGNSFVGYSGSNSSSSQSFLLVAGNGSLNYKITNTSAPIASTMQPGVTAGAVLELHAAKAVNGISPGINSPLTTNWYDTSGNGNNGTLTNMAGTTASGWAGSGTGGDPYRVVLDSNNDRILSSDLGVAESGIFTYEAWILSTIQDSSNWDHPTIISENGSGTAAAWLELNRYTTYKPELLYDDGTNYAVLYSSGAAVNDGFPHHVVGVGDGTNLRLYVDNVLRAGPTMLPAGRPSLTATYVGYGSYNNYSFDGSIAIARIYPFALSATQVATNYNAGPTW